MHKNFSDRHTKTKTLVNARQKRKQGKGKQHKWGEEKTEWKSQLLESNLMVVQISRVIKT